MRYLWDLYPAYLHDWTHSLWKKAAMAAFGCPLRVWDYAAAARVDEFAANSRNVQRRIWKAYRRESQVIYPPVAVETFRWMAPDDSYLIVSELVAYKRIEDAVRCFTRTVCGAEEAGRAERGILRPRFAGRLADPLCPVQGASHAG
jgi:hypothetical protein